MQRRLQKLFLLGAVMTFGATVNIQAEELPKITSESIGSLTLVQDGEEVFQIINKPESYKLNFDYWEVLNPYQESNTVDTETMYELYSTVLGLDFGSAVEVPEGTETGLEACETYLEMQYVSDPVTMNVAEPDCTLKILFGNATDDGGRYVTIEGSDAVYVLSDAAAESVLEIDPFDYLLKIPTLINIEYLKSVDIIVGEDAYSMDKDGDQYSMEGKTVEKKEFTDMYQALMNIFLKSDIEVNQDREREEVLRIVYNMKDGAPDAEVVYYTWEDEAYYAVEVNGIEQFLVDAQEVDALLKQIEETF
ncbi:MAG: DUF4340 domain-containing protein [Muricoprocola sp.]